jgi:hypothetical protein
MHCGIGNSQRQRHGLIRPRDDLWILRSKSGFDALMRQMRASSAPLRESLLKRPLLPQRNSVDDRGERVFTERKIQMLCRHRQRELRSTLQPLREI